MDEKGNEFPTSPNYSYACMLVTGDVKKSEYRKLAELVNKIDKDEFSKKYFIGISKEDGGYNLLTSEGSYKVEIGDLDRIHLKVKGFKTFVEKYLVYQQPEKYSKISVKYDNQIVTTLNPNFAENDSILLVGKKELAKLPVLAEKKAAAVKRLIAKPEVKKPAVKAAPKPQPSVSKPKSTPVKPKPKVSTPKKTTESKPATKPKGKVKIE